jgi:hypothetical protein
VQRGQIGESLERLVGGIVDHDGSGEHRAAVDHPVSRRLDPRVLVDKRVEGIADVLEMGAREVLGCDHPVGVVQQAKLETAGAGVHDEDVHVSHDARSGPQASRPKHTEPERPRQGP